ncbi:MAG: amidohydrolase [Gemmatimonadetes bacterium]|nr:amidohydrolase [Gemmatimonadota bacterium]NNM03524.1 amidohydrolase [Gemmatimonadota bacterium]
MAEALAVKGGFVQAVGTNREVRALRGGDTETVRLRGRMLVPGFIDSHTHFIPGGFQLSSVDLRDADSRDEFGRRILDFASGLEEGQWVTGGDWDHEMWGGELPHKDWIDAATLTKPVLVSRLDGHMALANSLALELAGITASTPVPSGGEIVLDPETGEPTGILKDEAMALVSAVMPEPSEEALDRALDDAVEHALSMGVTQTHHMGTWADLETFRRAHADGRLKMRVYSVVPISTWERLEAWVNENGRGDDQLWWGGLKGFVDGSLGSTTAWFYDPYEDDPSTSGLLTTDTASLRAWALAGDAAGLQLLIHAIGDQANDWLLDLYEQAIEENGPRDRRFRIEHAQHLSETAFPRFADLGVVPAMQPYHAIDDGRWAGKRIGSERVKTTYAFQSLLEAGADLSFGSDWTVAPMDVMSGIYAALTRRTLDGANPDGWVPEEKISLEVALTAYTWGSAYAGFAEDRFGQLVPGKYADLVVLSQDLFQVDPVEIPTVQVEMTVVGGEISYRKEG